MLLKDKIFNIYDKLYAVIEFSLSLIFTYSLLKILIITNYCDKLPVNYIIFAGITGIILIVLLFINITRYKKYIEKIFLSIIIPIGLIFLFGIIPNHVPDEMAHIYRAYDISKGNIIIQNSNENGFNTKIPIQLEEKQNQSNLTYKDLMEKMEENANWEDEVYVYNGAQSYAPILYIGSSIGFFIGKILNFNITYTIFLARILNFIISIWIGYIAIKKIPFGKIILLVYMCSPMFLQQVASVSSDAMINAIVLLFIALSLYFRSSDQKITKVDKGIYYLLTICIAISKSVYVPLILLVFLTLDNKQLEKKERRKLITTCLILGVCAGIGWTVASMKYKDVRTYVIENNINTVDQVKYIMKNPLSYVGTLINTLYTNADFYLNTFLRKIFMPIFSDSS